jgi:hypothetical protein
MKKILFTPILFAAFALALVGCAHRGPYLPVNAAVNDLENRANLVLLDRPAQNSITCSGVQETRLPDGRLQVAAHLRNREERRIQVQANCEFKDAQGFVVDSMPFQNVFFDENAQEDVMFTSMNTNAVNYTIRVRVAK